MEVQRKCQWCGKPFIAHTMVTRYCSKSCNEKAYKEKKRKQRLQEYEERVSVSAILSCRPFFILIFLLCIKMKHYGFSRKSIWKNLETFP